MLPFKVPQNIRMPDQIIGPLTLEQFLYLLFAAGVSYIIYIYVGYGNLFWAIAIPIWCLALAFAFVPVNEQPFSTFVSNLVAFLISPKVLIWRQMPPEVFDVSPMSTKKATNKEKEEIMHPEEVKSQLQQLSMILDTRTAKPPEIREQISTIKEEVKPILPKKETKTSTETDISSRFNQFKAAITGIFSRPKKANEADIEKITQTQAAKKEALAQIASSPARSK